MPSPAITAIVSEHRARFLAGGGTDAEFCQAVREGLRLLVEALDQRPPAAR